MVIMKTGIVSALDEKSSLIRKALKFATNKHHGQVRKISGSPYIQHPIMVSYIAANFKRSKNLHILICAAILHDVLEDTDCTPQELVKEFGSFISGLVFELTDDKEQIGATSKLEYQKSKCIGISNYALFLKLCDRYCNLSDSPKESAIDDTYELIQYIKKKRKLTASQKAIIKEIELIIDSASIDMVKDNPLYISYVKLNPHHKDLLDSLIDIDPIDNSL